MSVSATLFALALCLGIVLLGSWALSRRRREWRVIAPHVGAIVPKGSVDVALERTITWLVSHRWTMPWGSDSDMAELGRRAGVSLDVTGLRLRQLRIGVLSSTGVAVWGILRALTHPGASMIPSFAMFVAAYPLGGWSVRENLARRATARGRAMEMQLPTVLDLLAFAVAAGESVPAALRRVAATVGGPLGAQLDRAVRDVATGVPLAQALRSVAASTRSQGVGRAMRAIEVAVDRGTPLADVLRAQATDARTGHTRALLDVAGRKETAMMLPVVFLVLPMIVVVAVLPAVVTLRMS